MIGGYKAIILDPDIDSRMRLKQATIAVTDFESVQQCNALSSARSHLELAELCDVIFISHRFPQEETSSFIQQAKEMVASRDAAYVKLLPESEMSNASLAASMRDGFDGFLCEPYSVNGLVEITQLAAKVKKERSHAREMLTMTLLAREIAGQLDIIAQMKAAGSRASLSMHALNATCAVLKTLDDDSRQTYFEALLKVFEHIPAPSPVKKKIYTGPSRAVRERQEKKLIEKLKSEIEDSKRSEKKTAQG